MFPISLKYLSDKERHDYILNHFILNKNYLAQQRKHKRDIDVIRDHHRFLWDDNNDAEIEDSWEGRLAKRYYDKLFKEYCIADLSRYKENKVALRWRTEAEVVAGIGQFQCGSRKCMAKELLRSWEVNFAYQELGERKNALVKIRLCPEHSEQLNYGSKKREVKRLKRAERQQAKEEKKEKRKSKFKRSENEKYNHEIVEKNEKLLTDTSDNSIPQGSEEDKQQATTSTEIGRREEEIETSKDIWNKKSDIEIEPVARETEFERYLEDLLL